MEQKNPITFLRQTGLLPIVVASSSLALAYLLAALTVGGAPWLVPVGFAGGLMIWTLVEYVKHRFFDHKDPGHMNHHEAPLEDIRIKRGGRQAFAVIRNTLILSGPVCIGMLIADPSAGSAMLGTSAGVLFGYVAYRYVHVACHELPMRSRWAGRLKTHHAIHHFRDETVNFGITTAIWDHIFGTAWRPDSESARVAHGQSGIR